MAARLASRLDPEKRGRAVDAHRPKRKRAVNRTTFDVVFLNWKKP